MRLAHLLPFALLPLLGACAAPTFQGESPTAREVALANRDIQSAPLPRTWSHRLTPSEVEGIVRRAEARILPAARRVCPRLPEIPDCTRRLASVSVRVVTDEQAINATAAADGTVRMFGGLVSAAGSDAEVAGVLAHEVGHVVLGHHKKAMKNRMTGLLVGGLIGATTAVAAGAGRHGSSITEDSMVIGAAVGGLVYSKEMELEADQLAVYILHEAGYDVEAGGMFFARAVRAQRAGRSSTPGARSLMGFLSTHPADDVRIASWRRTAARVRSGAVRPVSRLEASCEAARRDVRRCTDSVAPPLCEARYRLRLSKCGDLPRG